MNSTETATMPIADIKISDRHRKEMGDLQGLADSIARHGLLQPIPVTPSGVLIAGKRRIEAMRLLKRKEIAVTVIDVADLLAAERAENSDRKAFTRSEAVAIGLMIEEQHRAKIAAAIPAARKRAGATRSGRQEPVKITGSSKVGNTRDVASAAVGMDGQTYTKAKDIVAAAEEDPEKFGDLQAQMDKTGNVAGTYREMKRRKSGETPSVGTVSGTRRGSKVGPVGIAKARETFLTATEATGVRFASMSGAAVPVGLTKTDAKRCMKTLRTVRRDIGNLIKKLEAIK